jgi:hypothetical protein
MRHLLTLEGDKGDSYFSDRPRTGFENPREREVEIICQKLVGNYHLTY